MKYDELIKYLRYCGTHDCAGEAEELIGCMAMWSDRDCKNCNAVLQLDAADAIEELQSQLPRWISVSDRLPEQNTRVIGFMAWKGITVIEYQHGKWYSIDHLQPLPNEAVTHWMPLPQQPKEETDG